jgi:hypothetical protein
MAIKSTTFGRTELSGQDAVRFIQHMNEDKPNEKLKLALERGKKILESMARANANNQACSS